MAYQYSTTPLFVADGDVIQFRYQAPPFWDYTETVTIQIGGLTQFWYITTVPEDFQPDPFPFTDVTNAELSTLYTYADGSRAGENIIVVSGLTPTTQAGVSLTANIVGGVDVYSLRIDTGTGFGPWFQPSTETTVVENGHRIQVRGTSSAFSNSPVRITLGIGIGYETWTITTKPIPLNIPEPFPEFENLTGQPIDKPIYSNIIRVQGLLNAADISVDGNGEYAISNNNTTTTNGDGFDVLSGVTFGSGLGTIANGQYLQLRLQSANTQFTIAQTSLSIGDQANGSTWQVTTGASLSTTPNSFVFPDVTGAIENFLVPSSPRPLGGITGLGAGIEVPVTLLSTTSSEVRIKINNGSVGVLPANVKNGDVITLYARSSANFSETVETQIQVGNLVIPTWQVTTNSGPDYDAQFNFPNDLTNRVPSSFVSSSVITVTDINRPITITATNGALISIDYDTAVPGPRTFDPTVNSTFYLILQAADQLLTPAFTDVVVGTEATNVPAVSFRWTITTYASVPPPASDLGVWYSRKTEKFDGYPIGTVLPIMKEGFDDYGDLSGDLGSRYAGFVECDGTSYPASRFPALWDIIGNTYGGNGVYDENTKTYTGDFNVPDYRNRRLAGTGVVDGTVASSSFLPVATVGKGIFDVGAQGGYWYFDKVDVSGTLPFEQVVGSGNSGTESPFFQIGTVKVDGLETLVESIQFNITGSVTGQVGPISDVIVSAPEHSHLMITAVVESEGGDPLIPWATRALFGSQATGTGSGDGGEGVYGGSNNFSNYASDMLSYWKQFINNDVSSNFGSELGRYNGQSLDDFIAGLPKASAPGGGTVGFSDPSEFYGPETTNIEFMVFWISPASVLNGPVGEGRLIDTANPPLPVPSTTREVTGVIDTEIATFRVDAYTSPTGVTNSHSHYITVDPIENPNTDYSGGNTSGAGIIAAPFGSGLGGAATTLQITFDQNEVQMDLTEGLFEFSTNIKKPFPDVALAPQRQVPILTPFHKTKYVIKAY